MASKDIFEAIGFLKEAGEPALRRFLRAHRGVAYAEMRFEAVFNRSGHATDGESRDSNESESAAFGLKVDFAGANGAIGHGQTGVEIGRLALSRTKLIGALNAGLEEAYERARFDAREKAAALKQLGERAKGLALGESASPSTERDEIAAVWQRDPRTLDPD